MDQLLIFSNQPDHSIVSEILSSMQAMPEFKDCRLGKATVKFHSDREPFVELKENVRGRNIVVVACAATDANGSVNDHTMMTLVLLDALRWNGARVEVVIFPYSPYARQDRRKGVITDRTAITAKLFARLLLTAAPSLRNVGTVEPHTVYLEGFFECTYDPILILRKMAHDALEIFTDPSQIVVVSPDVGGRERASAFATACGTPRPIAFVDKRRIELGQAKALQLVGDVRDADVIIVDDIIDTAGTLKECCRIVREYGAERILVIGVHGLLTGRAVERLKGCRLSGAFVTNSITKRPEFEQLPGARIIHIGSHIARAIHCIMTQGSLRSLGNNDTG
ncbi:MAG: ribose-phosphate diphosphokinase [Patescibacteria group bacterium]